MGLLIVRAVVLVLEGGTKVIVTQVTIFLYYQVTFMTFEYFFGRIMNVLPKIKEQWTKRLRILYILTNLLLIAGSTVDSVLNFKKPQILQSESCI